jgi:hypothetical protein
LLIGVLVNNIILVIEGDGLEAAQTFHRRIVLFLGDSLLTEHALRLSLEPASLFLLRDEVFLFILFFFLVISERQVDRGPTEAFFRHNLSLDL